MATITGTNANDTIDCGGGRRSTGEAHCGCLLVGPVSIATLSVMDRARARTPGPSNRAKPCQREGPWSSRDGMSTRDYNLI